MSAFAFLAAGSAATKIRIFVSYDREHDRDLLDQLVADAARATSAFEVSGQSMARSASDLWDEELRRAIRESEQVIVLCSEHTGGSTRMATELRIAQEEERPYTLLWGRRDPMCTRPTTAKPSDSMYSWTPEILRNQILTLRRVAESDERRARPREGLEPGSGDPR